MSEDLACHDNNVHVFVYGTLKKGQPNDYFMSRLSFVKYIGKGRTRYAYPLVVGPMHFNLPLLLKEKSSGKRVFGEIYEVDKASLTLLDEFEDHPNMYERFEIPVDLEKENANMQTVDCWTYFFKNYGEREKELEHMENYDSHTVKGRKYDTSENPDHPDHR